MLTEIHYFFDNKKLMETNSSYFSAQESKSDLSSNFKRISAAVLRWAAMTSKFGNKMNKLIHHLTEEIDEYGKETDTNKEVDLSSHFALLCMCGKTNEVASSLSKPILEAFGSNNDQYSNKKRGKRKNRNSLNTTIDSVELSPHVAIQILVDIFQVEDLSKTRQMILSSEVAYQTLQSALWDCTKMAERLFITVSPSSGVEAMR